MRTSCSARSRRDPSSSTVSAGEWLTERNAVIACRATAYAIAALVCGTIPYHVWRGSQAFLGLLEDDYFYYATIADHFVRAGHLTYDGLTSTNGFHPLWFLVILVLRAVCGRFGATFYVALAVISFASACASFELSRTLARRLHAGEVPAAVIAALLSLGTSRLVMLGMECTLGVPLLLWLLAEAARGGAITSRRAAWMGVLASLAVLSRLDIALTVMLLVGGFALFARVSAREKLRAVAAFCAGGVLVPLYVAFNLALSGSAIPVSGLAKQAYHIGFNPWYVRAVALTTTYGPALSVVLPLGVLAFLGRRRDATPVSPLARFVGATALTFAAGFWTLNALSGWIFFGWYAYPAPAAATAALAFAFARWPIGRRAVRVGIAAVLVTVQVGAAAVYFRQHGPGWDVTDNSMLAMSFQLRNALEQRPGRVAMGAIAGVAAYVVDRPFLQLEGIVGDRRMLEHIRRQDSLPAVLQEFGADYLVVTLATTRAHPRDGCYLITQPHAEWAGDRTSKLRGEICASPVVRFLTPPGPHSWSVFPELETLVWDLRTARWKTEADAN